MITAHHLVFGRKYKGIAYLSFADRGGFNETILFTTRNSNSIVKWGSDGAISNYTNSKNIDLVANPNGGTIVNRPSSTTHPNQTIIELTGGLDDVYSWQIGACQLINDFKVFFGQFPNLYSINFDYVNFGQPFISGKLEEINDSVERIYKSNSYANYNLSLNISNYSSNSKLKYLYINYQINAIGDLSKLPPLVNYFKLENNVANTLTYTSGKTWASSFDTLDLGNASLFATETDNLFNDMANSITTAIGSKVIRLANCYRTTASNTAVAYLQSLGFTITVLGIGSKILDLPLQNSFTDTTGINTMIAGGTSNLPTFTLEGGEYAATFNGSQSIKTNGNFIINNDKVSISFWMKTTFTGSGAQFMIDSSPNFDANNAFLVAFNNTGQENKIQGWSKNQGYNNITNPTIINDNVWRHFVFVIDRSLNGVNEIKCYENGVLMTVTKQHSADNSGNFVNNILYIGQRGGSALGFNGRMKFLKIFNYPLSTTEITNLYNKTM